MSRRRRAEKREVLPDPKFGDLVVTKFMNYVMYEGKKAVAENIVYGAFDVLEAKRKDQTALETFERTRKHLAENEVDLEKARLTLGPLLRLDPKEEKFLDHPKANTFLTREYRKPFVVSAAVEV